MPKAGCPFCGSQEVKKGYAINPADPTVSHMATKCDQCGNIFGHQVAKDEIEETPA